MKVSYIPYVISFALFMETLDITIVNTAIPEIAKSFDIDSINVKTALTSYLLSLAIFIPVSGWLADRYGSKRIFMLAIVLFTLSSFFCGAAKNLFFLILARFIQGIGGALMMPVGRLILIKSFSKQNLVSITNYMTIPSLLGPALGPLVGGIITTYINWKWIFFVNIPFGIVGMYFAFKVLPNYIDKSIKSLDILGFLIFASGLLIYSYLIEIISAPYFSIKTILTLGLIFLILSIYYIYYSLNTKTPFLDLKIFKIRTFRTTVLGSFITRCGIGGIPFLLNLFFQLNKKESPLNSGLLLLPFAIGMITMKFFVKRALRLLGFKKLLILNTFLLGLNTFFIPTILSTNNYFFITITIFFNGLLTSMQFSCMNVLTYIDLSGQNISRGTSIASSIQQFGMGSGIAISSLLIKIFSNKYDSINTFKLSFFLLSFIIIIAASIFNLLQANDGRIGINFNKT